MKKLVIILLPLVMDFVDAKYCAYEVSGETRFYTCPRTEYCCNFGCCVSPAFQFYQLWYYWLLVIFMFLLCSGGGWWYRCWLRGRFPETQTSINRTSAIPTTAHANQQHRRSALLRTTRSTPATPAPPPTEAVGPPGQNQFQVARVSYSTSGDRLILHRLWKDSRGGLHHMDSPPSYSTARADTQPLSLPAAASAVLMNPYVLYGPPPSYESVMQEDQAGPSGTQTEVSPPHESGSLSPEDEEEEPSIESCPSSQQVSPVSPCSPIEETSPTSPTSPNIDVVTSDEERGPQTSHQASQTVFSPVSSPTSL